jgi:hypothetical protein
MTATLDVEKGALTIKTTKPGGETMPYFLGGAPWYSIRAIIVSISIEDGVTTIGEKAFEDCSNLSSVTIPNSVTTIDSGAFSGCSNLSSVAIPNSVTSIGAYVFFECRKLSSVTIGNSVTTIGRGAFMKCNSLSSITIPNSVRTIDVAAFSGCSNLSSITIPNSVTSIVGNAFYLCRKIKDVTVEWIIPVDYDWRYSMGTYSDSKAILKNATLHVPAGTKPIYQSDDGWGLFGTIVEYSTTANEEINNPQTEVYITGNTLHINTPLADVLSIYTAAGVKVYEAPVPAGASTVSTANFPQGVLIVKGKVGWVKKVVSEL